MQGFYHKDTRHLSALVVTLDGARPMLLSSTLRDDNLSMTCDLSNPDLIDGEGRLRLERDRLHLRRSRFLWKAAWFERLSIRSFDDQPHRLKLGLQFHSDFADLFEVRGMRRERRGVMLAPKITSAAVILGYHGLDDQRRTTTLRFDPTPSKLSSTDAIFELDVPPGGANRSSLKSTAVKRNMRFRSVAPSSLGFAIPAASCDPRLRGLLRFKLRIRFSMKRCAVTSPISIC